MSSLRSRFMLFGLISDLGTQTNEVKLKVELRLETTMCCAWGVVFNSCSFPLALPFLRCCVCISFLGFPLLRIMHKMTLKTVGNLTPSWEVNSPRSSFHVVLVIAYSMSGFPRRWGASGGQDWCLLQGCVPAASVSGPNIH